MKLLLLALATGALAAPFVTALEGSYTPEAFCCLANYYRESKGLRPFKFSATVSKIPEGHVVEMAKQGKWTHDGLTPQTKTLMDRTTNQPNIGNWDVSLENVADKYTTMKAAMAGWYEHQEHYVNLMREGDNIVCGSGHYYNEADKFDYWDQVYIIYDAGKQPSDTVGLQCQDVWVSNGLTPPKGGSPAVPTPSTTPSATPMDVKINLSPPVPKVTKAPPTPGNSIVVAHKKCKPKHRKPSKPVEPKKCVRI
ncbi:hypothetical protein H4R34_005621 [Dimargaris verticillata]|uniref:SCP domain-containing protein n=1 Tax=Dimargaris verticillata TaxID=2761393 RepID=A0A9W8AYL2_9FUNG|nr:hypothetical protein H4R34_005621 [Dimargaris verticillata]